MFHQSESSFQQVLSQFLAWWAYFKPKLTPGLVAYAIACMIGGLFIVYGGWRVFTAGVTQYQTSSETEQADNQLPSSPQVVVEVAGAVEKPGVYTLPIGSRVAQALTEAGNPSIEADQAFLAKKINLAEELVDQQKIYIPFWIEDELGASTLAALPTKAIVSDELSQNKGLLTMSVSINTASAAQLMELEGIGEKRANDIIAGRPYLTLDDLVAKKIVTESQWEKIKDRVSL